MDRSNSGVGARGSVWASNLPGDDVAVAGSNLSTTDSSVSSTPEVFQALIFHAAGTLDQCHVTPRCIQLSRIDESRTENQHGRTNTILNGSLGEPRTDEHPRDGGKRISERNLRSNRCLYICPLCNMGEGHKTRPYNRKASAGTLTSKDSSINYKNAFTKKKVFDNHIKTSHIKLFDRINCVRFSEYICCLCPCDVVSKEGDSKANCHGRFKCVDSLLQHLRSAHAQDPDGLLKFDHWCGPLFPESYYPDVLQKAAAKPPSSGN